MLNNFRSSKINLFYELFSAIFITAAVVPGFLLLGNIIVQFLATAAFTFFFLLVADKLLKINAATISHSLIVMTVFWSCTAIVKQIMLHIQTNDYSFNWLHLFYYDRPAMLFVVFFVAITYFAIKLFYRSNDLEFLGSYKVFIKNTLISLLIYYVAILIYCFILTRRFSSIRPEVNLIPFNTIVTTFSLGRIDYELLFLFLGNIAIFFPLGIFLISLTKSKVLIAISPFVISVGVEVSQYFLGNGCPDIDDVILNVFGYFLGVMLKIIFDKILYKISNGKLKSIFTL